MKNLLIVLALALLSLAAPKEAKADCPPWTYVVPDGNLEYGWGPDADTLRQFALEN